MDMAGASKQAVDDGDPSSKNTIGTGSSITHLIYRFIKQASSVAAIYLLGYFNISPAWLICPLILAVLREEWKKDKELKRNIAKAAALSNEKEVILARVDDLPAWVFFPDIERAEWVNRILNQVWPNVNHYAKDIIKDVIEPAINESLAFYKLSGLTFQKMRLGTIPPRVGGIKVYEKNVSRSEIIMDVDLFYAGDCDISFTLKGLSGGVKDFQLHGMVRVVMKPLITTMPLVGGLQIYFLNNPTIDFNLVGMADLLDMPGLSDILRRVIVEQVALMMVLPNKLPIVLSDAVPVQSLKFPEPQGVLRVHVVEAKQLMKKDISVLGKGKSDPYGIITLGADTFKTKIINNTIEPKWDYWCEFLIHAAIGQQLSVRLMDHDDSKKDSKLGSATIEVLGVTRKGTVDTWIHLEEVKSGLVHLRMTWLQFSDSAADLKKVLAETQQLRVTSMSTAVLMVFLDSATNLPSGTNKSKPDAQATLSVAKVSKASTIQYRTDQPVYEQGFTFLVGNPENDTLHIKFADTKTGSELGTFDYNLSSLLDLNNLELTDQPFRLKSSGPESKLILSLRLRILKYLGGMDDQVDSLEPVPPTPPPVEKPATADEKSTPLEATAGTEVSSLPTTTNEPVVDVFSSTEQSYKVESAPSPVLRKHLSSDSSISEDGNLGKIQLTLRYSVQRQRLVIVIHKIVNLPLKDPSNIPDPYVKLYLLPERAKESKRKTETIKDNCNPVYDETFEYVMSQGELCSRQLEVTVLTQKAWKSPVLGQVIVNLAEMDLANSSTTWYDLQPCSAKEKEL